MKVTEEVLKIESKYRMRVGCVMLHGKALRERR